MKRKTITICASSSFYADVLAAEKILKEKGFRVTVPLTAKKMEKSGDFKVSTYKTWFEDPGAFKRKAFLMRRHFEEVERADAILVVNGKKNGIAGYIGGNGLMEMALAFHMHKPIYVLNDVLPQHPFYEEILGMQPVFLRGDLTKIR
jgi:hypothetical protein